MRARLRWSRGEAAELWAAPKIQTPSFRHGGEKVHPVHIRTWRSRSAAHQVELWPRVNRSTPWFCWQMESQRCSWTQHLSSRETGSHLRNRKSNMKIIWGSIGSSVRQNCGSEPWVMWLKEKDYFIFNHIVLHSSHFVQLIFVKVCAFILSYSVEPKRVMSCRQLKV